MAVVNSSSKKGNRFKARGSEYGNINGRLTSHPREITQQNIMSPERNLGANLLSDKDDDHEAANLLAHLGNTSDIDNANQSLSYYSPDDEDFAPIAAAPSRKSKKIPALSKKAAHNRIASRGGLDSPNNKKIKGLKRKHRRGSSEQMSELESVDLKNKFGTQKQ